MSETNKEENVIHMTRAGESHAEGGIETFSAAAPTPRVVPVETLERRTAAAPTPRVVPTTTTNTTQSGGKK